MATTLSERTRRTLRDALLPPWFEEPRTDESVSWFSRVRLFLIVGAIAIDLCLYGLLRGVDELDGDALDAFAAINFSVLCADLLVTALVLRHNRRGLAVIESAAIAMEMFAVAVWIQLTGTVSSYFIAAAFVLPFSYRVFASYRVGVVAWMSMLAAHAGAFALEELGVLRPASLFAGDHPIYQAPRYRHLVMATLIGAYVSGYGIANLFVIRRRRRDSELRDVRERLAQLARGHRYGRLSGTALHLGSYELGEVLGQGGMGEVYRARHADRGECAVKVLHPHLVSDPRALARFAQEAEAAARLPSEVAPAVLGVHLDGPERFIAMEYLAGEDLVATLRRRGRFPVDEAVAMLRDIADRIDVAHASGLVHRDLKPHNVFLSRTDAGTEVRLLDFGIAKLDEAHSELTGTGAILGSPGYMAPEQAAGATATAGPAADVFALGVIAYELLTGRRAFVARDKLAAIDDLLHRSPPSPTTLCPELHADVDDVIAIALAKAPTARFARARELADALAAAVGGQLSDELRARGAALAARTPTTRDDDSAGSSVSATVTTHMDGDTTRD